MGIDDDIIYFDTPGSDKINEAKVDEVKELLEKEKQPYLLANKKTLKTLFPEVNLENGQTFMTDWGLMVVCNIGIDEGKIITNVKLDEKDDKK